MHCMYWESAVKGHQINRLVCLNIPNPICHYLLYNWWNTVLSSKHLRVINIKSTAHNREVSRPLFRLATSTSALTDSGLSSTSASSSFSLPGSTGGLFSSSRGTARDSSASPPLSALACRPGQQGGGLDMEPLHSSVQHTTQLLQEVTRFVSQRHTAFTTMTVVNATGWF